MKAVFYSAVFILWFIAGCQNANSPENTMRTPMDDKHETIRKVTFAGGCFWCFDKPIVTAIVKFDKFYEAEDYHQDYSQKNPMRYQYYRSGSGRDRFLKKVWGDHLNTPKKH